ncbi:hypothetical protein BJ170DRAFT_698803 [Xylariales sp. AK1849]|nr:hypothetical protein BJ170DRAFT_698803 [Xylariales sp. AK1849]
MRMKIKFGEQRLQCFTTFSLLTNGSATDIPFSTIDTTIDMRLMMQAKNKEDILDKNFGRSIFNTMMASVRVFQHSLHLSLARYSYTCCLGPDSYLSSYQEDGYTSDFEYILCLQAYPLEPLLEIWNQESLNASTRKKIEQRDLQPSHERASPIPC